jgi:tetratricopeptide (TPR) repeat protein
VRSFLNKIVEKTGFFIAVFFLSALFYAPPAHSITYSNDEMMLENAGAFDESFLREKKDELKNILKNNFFNGNLDGVGLILSRLIAISPNDAELHALYALHFLSLNDSERGKEHFVKAQKFAPNNVFVLYAKAMNSLVEKKYNDAVQTANKSIGENALHPFPYNVIGAVHFEKSQFDLAKINFHKAIEINPEYVPAYTNLGFLFLRIEDLLHAKENFKKALDLSPKNPSNLYGMALAYDQEGNINIAKNFLQSCLEIKPSHTDALEKLAELQLKSGQYSEAEKTGEKLKIYEKDSADLIQAEAALRLGDTKKSLSLLKNINSNNPHVKYLTGLCLIDEKKYSDAIQQMKNVVRVDENHAAAQISIVALENYTGKQINPEMFLSVVGPDSLSVFKSFLAGLVAVQHGDLNLATEFFQESSTFFNGINLSNSLIEQLLKNLAKNECKPLILGLTSFYQKMEKIALSLYQEALEYNPESILTNYFLGEIYSQNRDNEKAVKHLEACVQKSPDFLPALIYLGNINFFNQKPQLAIKYYTDAIQLTSDPVLYYRLGAAYQSLNDFENAESQYRQLVDKYPDLYLGYNQLAWLYAKQEKKLDEALILAKKADKIETNNPIISDTIGWIYFLKNDLEKAEYYLKLSIDKEDKIPTILYHYGAVLKKKGDLKNAQLFVKKALDISPKFDGSDDARRMLESLQSSD